MQWTGTGTLPALLSNAPLVRLDVSGNMLRGTLPPVWYFDWLELADFSSNQLTVRPELYHLHACCRAGPRSSSACCPNALQLQEHRTLFSALKESFVVSTGRAGRCRN